MHVDLARARRRAQQLDAPGAVDEVEEDELAQVAARHHAAREPARLRSFFADAERVGFGPYRRDVVAIGEALRRRLGHGVLTIAQACGPPRGVSPFCTTRKPWLS